MRADSKINNGSRASTNAIVEATVIERFVIACAAIKVWPASSANNSAKVSAAITIKNAAPVGDKTKRAMS